MKKGLFCALMCTCLSATAQNGLPDVEVKTGDYKPEWGSLSKWECPEWFMDAKLGIWAHWGPQSHAEAGDWYGRMMYYDGSWQNNWHYSHFGDPSVFGLMDLCNDWKADKWDPEYLIQRYKSVGAKYFMSMGNHHDNFDNWNSPYQEWNSVNVGPKKDIVGGWAEMCEKYGLRFGVSMHASHAWTWLEPSTWYDGNLTKEDGYKLNPDGTEKWWKGMDPQGLYAQNHPHSTGWEDSGTIHSQWNWGNGAALPSEEYKQKFQNRVLQCINDYDPDMIYFDDTAMPFYGCDDRIGQNILAHYYNHSAANNDGKQDVVVSGKVLDADQKGYMLWDVERGIPDRMQEKYWQTCTCIGTWHYQHDYGYKDAPMIIRMLVDIVSKNGNLLLSVPVMSNGTIDDRCEYILDQMKEWLDINGEAIFGTRTWKTFGEGPTAEAANPLGGQGFNEGQAQSSSDVRYTQKDGIVYATIMAWPSAKEHLFKSFSMASEYYSGKVKSVKLLGYGDVKFTHSIDGLTVEVPTTKPDDIAPVYAIEFSTESGSAYENLQDGIKTIEEYVESVKDKGSYINTGKLNTMYLPTIQAALEEAKKVSANASEDEAADAIEKLLAAYNDFKSNGFNKGGLFTGDYEEDVTMKYLVEASDFTRKSGGNSRFGEPEYWTVENMSIPNGGDGVKRGLDKYEGYESLFLGVWNDAGNNQEGDLSNARLYRKISLPAGTYYFGAAYNACYQIGNGYMFVSSELCNTGDIPEKSIASYSLVGIPNNKQIHGLWFRIEEDMDVYVGFQMDLTAGSSTQEIRAERVAFYRLSDINEYSFEKLLLEIDAKLTVMEDNVSDNTGYYNETGWKAMRALCDELEGKVGDMTTQEAIDAYYDLNAAWTEYLATGFNEGGAPANVPAEDITVATFSEASGFARTDATNDSDRFGAPKYWTVDNFGFGDQAGIDRDPGYDCLHFEVWGNNAQYAQYGYDIANIRLYQQVTLPEGRYYFGASYAKFEPYEKLYIFASEELVTTDEINTKTIAYDKVVNANIGDGSFRGVTFELKEETTLYLGFQGDFTNASYHNLRVSAVKLLKYSELNFATLSDRIKDIEDALATVKISDNTGFYSQDAYDKFAAVLEEAKSVKETDGIEAISAAVTKLGAAYDDFVANGRNRAVNYDDTDATDITAEYLVDASQFTRADETDTHRFTAPLHWTVENYGIPAGNEGIRSGIDNYPGMDCLTIGVWNDKQNAPSTIDITNTRLYRKITLDAGEYYFGSIYESLYYMDNGYMFVATETMDTEEIPTKSISYCSLDEASTNGEYWGIRFTLDKKQEVIIGWQADLLNGSATKEFRAKKIKLAKYDGGVADGIYTPNDDVHAPVEFYSLQGMRLNGAPEKGFYIVKKGRQVMKYYKK